MAEIIGFIATQPQPKTSESSGRRYYSFRLAENSGTGTKRKATFYDVRAYIPDKKARGLDAGIAVRVRGRLDPQGFVRRLPLGDIPVPRTWDEIVHICRHRGALGASIVLLTSSVELHEFKSQKPRSAAA